VPKVVIHKLGQVHEGEVKENTNLVVRAGIKQFPYPYLRYGCGMGKCSRCACEVVEGAEHLPPPNWKETKLLAANLERGYRLVCQLWIHHDIVLRQDSDEVWAATIRPAGAAGDIGPGSMTALRPKPARNLTPEPDRGT
jgi:ferredoxin